MGTTQTLCSSQSCAPVAARATSVFLKGNVITLLINKKSDRTICHERAGTAAVAVILSLGFATSSRGKDPIVGRRQPLGQGSSGGAASLAALGLSERAESLAGSLGLRTKDTRHPAREGRAWVSEEPADL